MPTHRRCVFIGETTQRVASRGRVSIHLNSAVVVTSPFAFLCRKSDTHTAMYTPGSQRILSSGYTYPGISSPRQLALRCRRESRTSVGSPTMTTQDRGLSMWQAEGRLGATSMPTIGAIGGEEPESKETRP